MTVFNLHACRQQRTPLQYMHAEKYMTLSMKLYSLNFILHLL